MVEKTAETPYYKRTLDSFADAIITDCAPSDNGKGWYAWMDTGPEPFPSEADFATYAPEKDDAIRLCAQKIRDDAKGIGKYAPHFDDYALHHRYAMIWAEKEKEQANG